MNMHFYYVLIYGSIQIKIKNRKKDLKKTKAQKFHFHTIQKKKYKTKQNDTKHRD
jgi:hypothetical protein